MLADFRHRRRAGDLAGNYGLVGERESVSELTLKLDGAFAFGLIYGAANYWEKGIWRQDGESVILNSSAKEEPPFRSVKRANGQGVKNIKIALHSAAGELEPNTTREGVAEFPALKGAREARLQLRVYLNPAHNDFYFEINGKAVTEYRFEDERLRVNNDILELRMADSDRPGRYKKQ